MNIRNFSIIAHISHGKSTLADRFLELTGTVAKEKLRPQYLDSMALEREKGITIKMHPVRMEYLLPCHSEPAGEESRSQCTNNGTLRSAQGDSGVVFILNLIDTPGHIDFSYEISRALTCVEGAVLLVDATKGIQAQTIFNLELAKKQGLAIIGAINKIDLSQAQTGQAKKELAHILGVQEEEIFAISAKKGTNVKELLQAVVEKIPPPRQCQGSVRDIPDTTLALVFDSKYDPFSGVVAYVRVFEGQIQKGDKIYLVAANCQTEIKEVGFFAPELKPSKSLKAGEIGYVKTGIKSPAEVKVGETIVKSTKKGISDSKYEYKEPQPVLFLSLYPQEADDFGLLKESLGKLKLNDPALNFQPESKMALGRGFRCGFLGSLHAEITIRRLKQEFGLDLIATSPQVIFKILLKNTEKPTFIASTADWPEPAQTQEIQEPWVGLEIITPNPYFSSIFKLLKNFKAALKETKFLSEEKSILLAEAPLRELINGNFYDKLKSTTEGYASFAFKNIGFRRADLVKVDVLIAGKKEEAFSMIIPREQAFSEGKKFLQKLKEILPPAQFAVSLQTAIGGKIIARETVRAKRKDVTAPLYGGDVTRKRKLLEIQKKGKKKLKEKGRVSIPAGVFLEILK